MEVSEIAKLLKDPMWRISHLYEIKLTDGEHHTIQAEEVSGGVASCVLL